MWRVVLAGMLLASMILLLAIPVAAEAPATDAFQRTWSRTDQPVLDGAVSRTWMWGPEAFTGAMTEPYAESPGGERTVQYFDKSRMEDNSYRNDSAPWDVTNGLLVVELISGRMQTGDNSFEDRAPAQLNVVGDADAHTQVQYNDLAEFLDQEPHAVGDVIHTYFTWSISGPGNAGQVVWWVHDADEIDGSVSDEVLQFDVPAAHYVSETNHSIAEPFWEFMNSAALVHESGNLSTANLFPNPFYATGFPITEPNWTKAAVAGTAKWVLMQCFERRCLTYTPDNPEGWQVEAGNVGQHYHTWRYGGETPPADDGGDDIPPAQPDEDEFECLRVGFPCTLAETPPEIANRMFDLGEELGVMLNGGTTISQLVAHAESQPDVVEVFSDDNALRFRIGGAPPAWVYDTDFVVDLIPDQEQNSLLDARAAPLTSRIEPSQVVGKDRDNDGMTDEEPKRALILSPYRWQFGSNDEGRELRDLLSEARGYEGHVDYFENTKDADGNIQAEVIVDMFGNWADYDVIHVSTHGRVVCDFLNDTTTDVGCYNSISTGVEITRDDVANTRIFGGQVSFDGDAGKVSLTDDYFLWNYPTGLDDSIVFFSACESFPSGYDPDLLTVGADLPQKLSGLGGVFVGWDESVLASSAKSYAMDIFRFAIEIGRPFDEIVDDYSLAMGPATYTNSSGDQVSPSLQSYAGGDSLRIREVVFQKHPLTDEDVEDGDALPIIGQFEDGEEDRLPFVVEVDGIVNNPGEFIVHVQIDGEDRPETFSMADGELIDDNKYRLDEVDVSLGFDAQEDQQIKLRVWVDLPEGGESKHTANVRLDNPILDFRSIMESNSPAGDIRSEVHAEFTLIYNEDFSEIEPGETTLEYISYEITIGQPECDIVTETHDGTFEAVRLDFPTGAEGKISSLVPNAIALRPQNDIYATTTAVCPQGTITIAEQDIHWFAAWVVMHGGSDGSQPGAADEFSNAEGAWVIEDWQNRPIQKVYNQQVSLEDVTLNETTTLKIMMPDE